MTQVRFSRRLYLGQTSHSAANFTTCITCRGEDLEAYDMFHCGYNESPKASHTYWPTKQKTYKLYDNKLKCNSNSKECSNQDGKVRQHNKTGHGKGYNKLLDKSYCNESKQLYNSRCHASTNNQFVQIYPIRATIVPVDPKLMPHQCLARLAYKLYHYKYNKVCNGLLPTTFPEKTPLGLIILPLYVNAQ